jgi:hypothetical protein
MKGSGHRVDGTWSAKQLLKTCAERFAESLVCVASACVGVCFPTNRAALQETCASPALNESGAGESFVL